MHTSVSHYDVRYKVGAGGTWTDWVSNTTKTGASFVGEADESYYFRVRTTDVVSNTADWEGGAAR